MYFSCDYCGAGREWDKQCPNCFSKKRPSRKATAEAIKKKTYNPNNKSEENNG